MRLLNVSLSNDRGTLNLPVGPGLTLVQGSMGCGKSMLVRDTLLLLLSGSVPGKRKLDSLGEKLSAGVTLEMDDGTGWPILRQGRKISVLGQDGLDSASTVTGALASRTGLKPSDLAESVYKTDEDIRALLLSSKRMLDFVKAAAGLLWFGTTASGLGSEVSRLEPKEILSEEDRRQLEVRQAQLEADIRRRTTQLQQLEHALERMLPNEAYCRELANRQTPENVEKTRAQAEKLLGEQNLDKSISAWLTPLYDGSILQFASRVAAELAEKNVTTSSSVSLQRAVLQSKYARGPVLQALDTLTRLDSIQTATAKDITDAINWLKVLDDYRRKTQELQTQLKQDNMAAGDIRARLQADLNNQNNTNREKYEKAKRLQAQFLRNQSDASLQDVARSWVVGRVLGTSTYLLQRVLHDACLKQAPDGSIKTSIGGTEIPAEQLSNGQILVCALSLQLGILAVFGTRVPFLVLDDITGACGDRAQDVVTMLQDASRNILKKQIVLLTSDRLLRADCMRRL